MNGNGTCLQSPAISVTTSAPHWTPLPGHVYILIAAGTILYETSEQESGYTCYNLMNLVEARFFLTVNADDGGNCTLVGGGPV